MYAIILAYFLYKKTSHCSKSDLKKCYGHAPNSIPNECGLTLLTYVIFMTRPKP